MASRIIPEKRELDSITRVIHLGLTVFGVLAFFTGFFAEDYKRLSHPGFTVHKWLGLTLGFFMVLRLGNGLWGPPAVQFRLWVPYTRERLLQVWEDCLTLLQGKLPDRPLHEGLSGLVQTFGLAVFAWMAGTGSVMFFFLTPGGRPRGALHVLKEMHEAGLWLIVVFLSIHVGAVMLHALAGNPLWRKTFFLDK